MTPKQLIQLALIVFVGVTCVVIGDTAGKLLTAQGVAPFTISWTRFGLAAVILLPFCRIKRSEWAFFLDKRIIFRAALVAGGISCILTALKTEPIANVFGAFFIGPIISYVIAVIFLGERPSLLRTGLLLLGFAGVLLVVKPGFGASVGMFFALGAGTSYGVYLAMTRLVANEVRPMLLLFSQLFIGTLLLTPFGIQYALPPFSSALWFLLILSALGSAAGNYLVVQANRIAEASLIAPLVYTQLISAVIAGIVVFGTWPDMTTFLGLCLIFISGVGSLVFSQRR